MQESFPNTLSSFCSKYILLTTKTICRLNSIFLQETNFSKVYAMADFYLLVAGWKWRIQKSTDENDKSAVEVLPQMVTILKIVIILHVLYKCEVHTVSPPTHSTIYNIRWTQAVQVGSALPLCPAISSSSTKSLLEVVCKGCPLHQEMNRF